MGKLGFAFAALAMVFVTGCGNSPGGGGQPQIDLAKLGGVEFGLLEKGSLVVSATSLTGSGKIIVREPRPKEDSNYALAFSLQPGGSLTLITNSDRNLSSGVTMTFARPATGEALKVTLKVGSESYDVSGDFSELKANAALAFDIDVHAHGHVIAFLSEEKELAFTTRVSGSLWGLVLDKATVTKLVAAGPKDVH